MTERASRIPPPPGEEELPVHNRTYSVQTFRINNETMRLRGRVTDTKPASLYIDGDLEPLDVHDMVVDLVVGYPDLTIQNVDVVFDTHPHTSCPSIEVAYQKLVDTSIARGFTRKLTELFGGPSGCTHVGALLKAMAPVAVQSMYSMRLADPDEPKGFNHEGQDEHARQRAQSFVRNSCHVWAEDGPMMAASDRGEPVEAPLWIRDRLEKLGRSDEMSMWE